MRARVLRTAVVLLAVVAAGVAVSRTHRLYDLTAESSLTLTDTTLRVVGELDRDVEITAFIRRDEPGRVEAATLLDRYRKLNRRIDWDLLDPDTSPGELARLGVDPFLGGVAVRSGDEIERAPAVTEQDLTAALARLGRDRDEEVCITTGHGEPDLEAAAALLEREGYAVRIVDLLSRPEVPATCTAVVLAGPAAPLGDAAESLAAWTAADGKLLVLSDPASDVDLAPVLEPFGLRIERGVVFEGDPAAVVNADVTAPIVRTYSSANPIVRRLAPTYFPGVQSVELVEGAEARVAGLVLSRLADTSPQSYLETEPLEAVFEPGADRPGPITVAASADIGRNTGTEIRRTRVVAVGDVDFVTDPFLDQAANADLFVRAVAWLALDADLLALSANLPADRPLALTDARIAYARILTAAIVPALFVLAGAMVWSLRRRR